VNPRLVRAGQVTVIVALTIGAVYLAVSGWQAIGDRTDAARTAGQPHPTEPAPTRRPAGVSPPSALFIGDGYTSGDGDVDRAHSFACLTAKQLDWVCNNGGQPGTGYLAAGPDGVPYPKRIPTYQKAYAADYVVVSGGTEDEGAPFDLRVAAATRTYDAVESAYPRAKVIVVGPFASATEADHDLRRFDAAIKEDAKRRGWLFVETLDPPWLSEGEVEDGGKPTPAAHADLAGLLVTTLQAQGVVPGQRPGHAQPSRPSRVPITSDTQQGDR
jgi:hypothetical protein